MDLTLVQQGLVVEGEVFPHMNQIFKILHYMEHYHNFSAVWLVLWISTLKKYICKIHIKLPIFFFFFFFFCLSERWCCMGSAMGHALNIGGSGYCTLKITWISDL